MASLTDCLFYYKGNCAKGDQCFYRHEPTAFKSCATCQNWLYGICTNRACPFRHPSFQSAKFKMTQELATEAQQFESRGSIWSADDIVNIRKEPIAVELKVHDNSPDHRNIRQATVDNLKRKITIPKDKLDMYYSVCEPEVLHIKSLNEIQRERDLQEKIQDAKQKYRNVQCSAQDFSEMQTSVQSRPVSRQLSAPCRRLISGSTVEAQLSQLDSLPINLVPIALVEHNTPTSSSITDENVFVTTQLQQSKSYDHAVPTSDFQPEVNVDYTTVSTLNPVVPNGLLPKSRESCVPDTQRDQVSVPNVTLARKTTRQKSKSKTAGGQPTQPYGGPRKNQHAAKAKESRSSIDIGIVKVESGTLKAPSKGTTDKQSTFHRPSLLQRDFPTHNTGGVSPTQVVSGPPSPHHTPQQTQASNFWRSHSTPNDLHSQVSLTRLSKLSDSLTGFDQPCGQPVSSHVYQRPVVSDVLNITQDEISMLHQSVTCAVKQEPVFEPATPPDSSDDDIIWDDEVDDSEDTHHDITNHPENVLNIYDDGALSDSEYLLDMTNELLQ